jgi:hypothetical protein
LALAWRHEELIGLAPSEGTEEDQPVALRDHADPLLQLTGENAAEDASALGFLGAALLADERRFFHEPDQLGVRVLETRARCAALVDERVDVGEPLLPRGRRACLPCLGDVLELAEREVGEGAHMPGGVNDDLMATAGRSAREEAGLVAFV